VSRKRWLPFAILGVGLLVVAIMVATRPTAVPTPSQTIAPLVRVQPVQPRSVELVVNAHGTVVPRTESELVPQVSGEVVWVSPAFVPGGFFAAGEPLVRIDPADTLVALETARATVARAESEYDRALKERDRQRRLAEGSVASQARIDDAENAFHVSAAALREARARLERAERDLERTELRAPYDGRVRRESVDVGQFVNRGAPIAVIYAVDYAEVRLPVPDRQLAYLDLSLGFQADPAGEHPGPPVVLRAEFAGRSHEWHGHVVRTEGELDPRSRMVQVVARVADPYDLDDGDATPLAVGLFVEAEIQGRRVDDAVVLPRSALREGNQVLVVDAENRVRFRDVDVLRARREEVVISAGLVAGERVCVSPLPAAVEGMSVRVLDESPGLASSSP
jgi:RND family efflux transporter MFP subunit